MHRRLSYNKRVMSRPSLFDVFVGLLCERSHTSILAACNSKPVSIDPLPTLKNSHTRRKFIGKFTPIKQDNEGESSDYNFIRLYISNLLVYTQSIRSPKFVVLVTVRSRDCSLLHIFLSSDIPSVFYVTTQEMILCLSRSKQDKCINCCSRASLLRLTGAALAELDTRIEKETKEYCNGWDTIRVIICAITSITHV